MTNVAVECRTPVEPAPLAACLNHTQQALLTYYQALADLLRIFGCQIEVQTLEDAGVVSGAHGVLVTNPILGVEYTVTIGRDGLRYKAACLKHSAPCRCLGLRVARFLCWLP